MTQQPKIIKGGFFTDYRGSMRFVNDFNLKDAVRFYTIKHPDVSVIRAWQAHKLEKKYFYPISGIFVVAWVKVDDFDRPTNNLKAEFKILSADKSEILALPKGFANGFKALEPNAELLIFSDKTIEASTNDIWRYDVKLWFDWENLKSLN